jgi:hypothetical protein
MSISKTLFFLNPSVADRLVAVEVFPTPPFCKATDITTAAMIDTLLYLYFLLLKLIIALKYIYCNNEY